jgi:VWFA-related protein
LIRTSNKQTFLSVAFPLAIAAMVAFLLFVPVCMAQETVPPTQQVMQVSTELVKLDVSVLDKHGDFAGGLEKGDFRILDNGVVQPIVFFAPVEAPAEILVLVETSPAVFLIHKEHLVAAYALIEGLAPDDLVGLATYDEVPHALLEFTSDKSALLAALGRLQYMLGAGDLNFYDSVASVVDWVPPAGGKRALVLLTTGLDSSPQARWDALVRKLRGQDVVIYSVALGGSLRGYTGAKSKATKNSTTTAAPADFPTGSGGSLSFAKSSAALLSLATITGGHAYFPVEPKDFVPMYREIASALRHQYVLGISPQHDGQFHPLTVQVLGSKGRPASAATKKAEYRIYAREGYLAPGP